MANLNRKICLKVWHVQSLTVLNPIWYPILLSYFEKIPRTKPTLFLWTYASKEILTENCINKSSGMIGIPAVVFTLAGNISTVFKA